MRTTAVSVCALISLFTLAGCGSADHDAAPTKATSSASGSATDSPSTGIISPPNLPTAPAFKKAAKGVINDVSVTSCSKDPGTVRARGTAKNSGPYVRSVVVTMNWAVPGTGDVVARGVAVLKDLRPGAETNWSVRARLAGGHQVECVPTAQAGQLRRG